MIPAHQITSELKYHSFIVCQTQDKQIAEKWDYYILSSQGQLLMNSEEHKSDYEYNLSVDTIACTVNNRNLVLAMGDWLKTCLPPTEVQRLKKHRYLKYDALQLSESIKFLYYIGVGGAFGERFIQVKPEYILELDCLIFQYSSPAVEYKELNNFRRYYQKEEIANEKVFSFRSEYALLSDMHFLNCLVRFKKQIGSYVKEGSLNAYSFWINPRIISIIFSLYSPAKL